MADIVYPGRTAGGTLGTGFMPANYNMELWRGDYFPMTITLKNDNGTALNLTGYTAKASIRANFDDPVAYNFTVTITAATGTISIVLPSSVSSTIPAGDYIWDFQVTEPSGNNRTYIAGDVRIFDEVTR